jgi:hypothetical protein
VALHNSKLKQTLNRYPTLTRDPTLDRYGTWNCDPTTLNRDPATSDQKLTERDGRSINGVEQTEPQQQPDPGMSISGSPRLHISPPYLISRT